MPRSLSPTHFICIPLASPQLAHSLAAFRSDVTSPNGFALPASAVRPLGTMHLTLGVMALPDEPSLSRARDTLKQIRLSDKLRAARGGGGGEAVSSQEPLRITLKGLHAMQDASRTTVLYAPPEDDEKGTLYEFCRGVRAEFERAGLVAEEKGRPLLLHATVVNTIYVPGQRGARGRKEKMVLDARGLIDSYDGYVWMEGMELDKVTLCKMGAKQVEGEDDEKYEVVEEIGF